MEVNDFMDLNTTELFDDSNDSFDNNEDGNNSEIIISGSDDDNSRTSLSPDNECDAIIMDEIISSDAEKTSTDVVSLNFYYFLLPFIWNRNSTIEKNLFVEHYNRSDY